MSAVGGRTYRIGTFEDDCVLSRHVLTKFRVRAGGAKGNHVHSVNVLTLGIPKMYMGTLGYNVLILQ